jgi:hypothetical protein
MGLDILNNCRDDLPDTNKLTFVVGGCGLKAALDRRKLTPFAYLRPNGSIFPVEAPMRARSISAARSYDSLAGKNGDDLFGRSKGLTDALIIIMMIIIRIITR